MPKRFCSCLGCPACASPDRKPGSHSLLFDADSTRTLKCPGCQGIATQKRQQRAPRAARGYDAAHDRERTARLAAFRPGDPCALCGQPMNSNRNLDLAHNETRTGWKGLAHARCNRNTGSTGRNASR